MKCLHCKLYHITDTCPICDDPRKIEGEYHSKESIVRAFVRYLTREGYSPAVLAKRTIKDLMMGYPKTMGLYHSNLEYRTVNLPTGTTFVSCDNEYIIGPRIDERNRVIQCQRCNNIATYTTSKILDFYLGYLDKRCQRCDWETEGRLKASPRSSRSDSQREMAKALNVSLSTFRRGGVTEPVPALPIGTSRGTLEITEAYWDETKNQYTPKYRLKCTKCSNTFVCLQTQWDRLDHKC